MKEAEERKRDRRPPNGGTRKSTAHAAEERIWIDQQYQTCMKRNGRMNENETNIHTLFYSYKKKKETKERDEKTRDVLVLQQARCNQSWRVCDVLAAFQPYMRSLSSTPASTPALSPVYAAAITQSTPPCPHAHLETKMKEDQI